MNIIFTNGASINRDILEVAQRTQSTIYALGITPETSQFLERLGPQGKKVFSEQEITELTQTVPRTVAAAIEDGTLDPEIPLEVIAMQETEPATLEGRDHLKKCIEAYHTNLRKIVVEAKKLDTNLSSRVRIAQMEPPVPIFVVPGPLDDCTRNRKQFTWLTYPDGPQNIDGLTLRALEGAPHHPLFPTLPDSIYDHEQGHGIFDSELDFLLTYVPLSQFYEIELNPWTATRTGDATEVTAGVVVDGARFSTVEHAAHFLMESRPVLHCGNPGTYWFVQGLDTGHPEVTLWYTDKRTLRHLRTERLIRAQDQLRHHETYIEVSTPTPSGTTIETYLKELQTPEADPKERFTMDLMFAANAHGDVGAVARMYEEARKHDAHLVVVGMNAPLAEVLDENDLGLLHESIATLCHEMHRRDIGEALRWYSQVDSSLRSQAANEAFARYQQIVTELRGKNHQLWSSLEAQLKDEQLSTKFTLVPNGVDVCDPEGAPAWYRDFQRFDVGGFRFLAIGGDLTHPFKHEFSYVHGGVHARATAVQHPGDILAIPTYGCWDANVLSYSRGMRSLTDTICAGITIEGVQFRSIGDAVHLTPGKQLMIKGGTCTQDEDKPYGGTYWLLTRQEGGQLSLALNQRVGTDYRLLREDVVCMNGDDVLRHEKTLTSEATPLGTRQLDEQFDREVGAYFEAGHYDQALAVCDAYERQSGVTPVSAAIRGSILCERGRLEPAEEAFTYARGILETYPGLTPRRRTYLQEHIGRQLEIVEQKKTSRLKSWQS